LINPFIIKRRDFLKYPVFSLEGKVALVTGGRKGIGACAAMALANAGADIILVSRSLENIELVETEIKRLGRSVFSYSCDVSDLVQIKKMSAAAIDCFGKIDILLNNAGVAFSQYALDVTPGRWDATHSINLRGLFFCCQAFGKHMIESGIKGKIINMASTFSVVAYPQRVAYASAKGGVVQLTKVLALEWAKYGITVNCISPTAIKTDMIEALVNDKEKTADFIRKIPLGRLGEPTDISGAVVFLAAPASDFITGHNLLIDGGWTIQ